MKIMQKLACINQKKDQDILLENLRSDPDRNILMTYINVCCCCCCCCCCKSIYDPDSRSNYYNALCYACLLLLLTKRQTNNGM